MFPTFAVIKQETMKMDNIMPEEVNIEIDEKIADGAYSNLAIISHSSSEFVLDFICLMPAADKGRVRSRIILAPEHAKRLLFSLQENITRYESTIGKIEIPQPHAGEEPVLGLGMKSGKA